MTDTIASARYAAQRATVDNILGDLEIDAVIAMTGIERVKDILLREIGQCFVNSEESDAEALRQALWNLESLAEVADRLVEEHERVEAGAP